MAKSGDLFFPIQEWTAVSMANARVGMEFTWALNEQDHLAGRTQHVKLHLSADQATKLAEALVAEAALSKERGLPN